MEHREESEIMADKTENLDIVTELEILLREYKELQSLLVVFGDGAKESLGEYDVTKGIYAIAKAMEMRNDEFQKIFQQIVGEKK